MALGIIVKICEMGQWYFTWARLFSLGIPHEKQSINVYFAACPLSRFWFLYRADSRVFPAWISSKAIQRFKVLFLVLSIGFAKALTLCPVCALPLPSVSFLLCSGPCLQPTNSRSIWPYGFPRNNDLFLCSNFFLPSTQRVNIKSDMFELKIQVIPLLAPLTSLNDLFSFRD